jgi:hypothetical protein
MEPSTYCTLEVRGAAAEGIGTMVVPVLQRAMMILHSVFSRSPDSYAVDFPEHRLGSVSRGPRLGRAIRLFSVSRESCEQALDALDEDRVLIEYLVLGRVRSFSSEHHAGAWVSMHRFRVAPRTQPDNRLADIERQNHQSMPFLILRSQSTGHRFSLMLDRRLHADRSDRPSGMPNSYGLSERNNPVYLPVLPA